MQDSALGIWSLPFSAWRVPRGGAHRDLQRSIHEGRFKCQADDCRPGLIKEALPPTLS